MNAKLMYKLNRLVFLIIFASLYGLYDIFPMIHSDFKQSLHESQCLPPEAWPLEGLGETNGWVAKPLE